MANLDQEHTGNVKNLLIERFFTQISRYLNCWSLSGLPSEIERNFTQYVFGFDESYPCNINWLWLLLCWARNVYCIASMRLLIVETDHKITNVPKPILEPEGGKLVIAPITEEGFYSLSIEYYEDVNDVPGCAMCVATGEGHDDE